MTNATKTATVRGNTITAADVEAVMDRFDAEGEAAVLEAEGFRRSTTYWLRGARSHRAYPSKAVLCIAAGLTSAQYFGGADHTVRVLTQLGFVVTKGKQAVRTAGIDALRAEIVAAGNADPVPAWDEVAKAGVTPTAYFASGSNSPNVIRAMAARHVNVGVAAPELRRVCRFCGSKKGGRKTSCEHTAEAALVALAGTDILVFCDSGAFSEVKFNPSTFGFDVVKPITDARWNEIMALYLRLANGLGSQLFVVAPDQVGSQAVTLERLARYSEQLNRIADTGARVMVVAQKGELSQADFYVAAVEAAGLTGRQNVVAGLPCKKAATSAEEVAAFVSATAAPHVHLLGIGPASKKVADYLRPFATSTASVSLDSCWVKGNVGRTNGPGNGPRRHTKNQDAAEVVLLAAGLISKIGTKVASEIALKIELALAVAFGAPLPAAELARVQLRGLWKRARAGAQVAVELVAELLPLVPEARPHFVALGLAA